MHVFVVWTGHNLWVLVSFLIGWQKGDLKSYIVVSYLAGFLTSRHGWLNRHRHHRRHQSSSIIIRQSSSLSSIVIVIIIVIINRRRHHHSPSIIINIVNHRHHRSLSSSSSSIIIIVIIITNMYMLWKQACTTDQHSEVYLICTTLLEFTQTQNYSLSEWHK
jgi:ABC-type Fe3+-siderophore transport system permease subunit